MPLSAGSRLGPYEIVAPLGAGGMGEVYRGHDTRLGRDVAIKVLPEHLRDGPDALARFEREARAVGALSHPNVVAVFDVGSDDGVSYVVMELLQGQTLRERLTESTGVLLTQKKAIEIAVQVAHGLAAAHAKGIVHRDLKPENIFLTTDGRAKILDFGLARPTSAAGVQADDLTVVSPVAAGATTPGVVLGTAGYMAPEQVRGQSVDHRADVFAFGCVLFEMLCGKRAFDGNSAVERMHAILTRDPLDRERLPAALSPALEGVVHHCLEKAPDERFQSVRDLAFQLQSWQTSLSESNAGLTMTGRAKAARGAWLGAAGLALGAAIGASAVWLAKPSPPVSATSDVLFPLALPDGVSLALHASSHAGGIAVSPDGRSVIFTGRRGDDQPSLYVRKLGDATTRLLPDTTGASFPFWSADSRRIAFCQGSRMWHVAIDGGPPETLAGVCRFIRSHGAWRADGTILVAPSYLDGLVAAPAGGGDANVILDAVFAARQVSYFSPLWLPAGDRFLVSKMAYREESVKEAGLFVGRLGSSDLTLLVRGMISEVALSDGDLLFRRGTDLISQPFNPATATLHGAPRTLATGVHAFSAAGGTVVYWAPSNGLTAVQRIARWSRTGERLADIGKPGIVRDPRLSRNGRMLAYTRANDQGHFEIWVHDLERDIPAKVSSFNFSAPVWAPDGRAVVAAIAGSMETARFHLDRPRREPALPKSDQINIFTDWSADGAYLLGTRGANQQEDLYAWPLDGAARVTVAEGEGNQRSGAFAPNGAWVAFQANDRGTMQIFVTPFPTPGERIAVASIGGRNPRWREDGSELFFLSPANEIVAVPVTWSSRAAPAFGKPRTLFAIPSVVTFNFDFDVFPDGQSFVAVVNGEPDRTPMMVRVAR